MLVEPLKRCRSPEILRCRLSYWLKMKHVMMHGTSLHYSVWMHNAHPKLYDSRMQLLPEYVGGYCTVLSNPMKSINLLPFIMPRTVENRSEVPVIVILHGTQYYTCSWAIHG
jgi:hypothetical protein